MEMDENATFHVDIYSEKVLVTTLLGPRDSKFHCAKADAARDKEIASLEARNCVRWGYAGGTLITLDQFEAELRDGTWSSAQMLTSEKFTEMNFSDEEAILKGRLVHCGDKEWNWRRQNVVDEGRRLLTEKGLSVKPVTGTELRGSWRSSSLSLKKRVTYLPCGWVAKIKPTPEPAAPLTKNAGFSSGRNIIRGFQSTFANELVNSWRNAHVESSPGSTSICTAGWSRASPTNTAEIWISARRHASNAVSHRYFGIASGRADVHWWRLVATISLSGTQKHAST